MFTKDSICSRLENSRIKDPLLEKFIRYVKIETTSDSQQAGILKPTTICQLDLCRLLQAELLGLGINDVTLDEYGFVIAKIPATKGFEDKESILFGAHVDTSDSVSGKNVSPQLHYNYNGETIVLADGLTISPSTHPQLLNAIGDTIIHTDGKTLLGGDDKAGVAAIMTAIEFILKEKVDHGPIEVIFNTDEEVGTGMHHLSYDKINSKIGYCIDGCEAPECNTECFNAYKAKIEFNGFVVHPGYARGKLINAVVMASTFVSMLPRNESPEATDERYGYFYVSNIEGSAEKATISINIRDFDMPKINERIERLKAIGGAVEAIFPGGKVTFSINKQYHNLHEALSKQPEAFEKTKQAFMNVINCIETPLIRGGFDGAELSENGIPTMNIFNGCFSIHSKVECVALSQMIASTEIILELIKLWSQ